MDQFISVAVLTLARLFSDTYRFHLPWFQRAYAWREEHVGRLLADIVRAMGGPKQRYFLGDLCLAKAERRAEAGLIDGHQRTITLTILFALLRDLAPDGPEKTSLAAAISKPVNVTGSEQYRISPQPGVAEFFRRLVQAPGGTLLEPEEDIMNLAESERYILCNRNHLRAMLADFAVTPEARSALAQFLLTRCCVVVKSVEDEEEAWAILSAEEETGLAHHSSERAKVSLISAMPRGEQEDAGRIYEKCQALVGADDLCRLLSHVVVLKLRSRSPRPVEKDLLQLFQLNRSGLAFLEHELLQRAKHMDQIKKSAVGKGRARADISQSLGTLLWLDHQLWMPPALHWLAKKGVGHRETSLFFRRLDRLAWMLKLSGTDPTEQEKRFIRLIGEIDKHDSVNQMPVLEISDALRMTVQENLRSRTFYAKRYSGLVLRRISRNLGSDPGPVDGSGITIEHVLPRKPKGQAWGNRFKTAAEVSEHANRLGNLAFLTLDDNQRAGTLDYKTKRKILQRSGFLLSKLAVKDHADWTAEIIRMRTEALIKILAAPWQIEV